MSLPKFKFSKSQRIVLVLMVSIFFLLVLEWNISVIGKDNLQIEIKRGECTTAEKVLTDTGVLGRNLWLISFESVEKKLMDKYPCILQVRMERKFPNRLQIKIEGREPLVAVIPFKANNQPSFSETEATPSSSAVLLDWSFPATLTMKSYLTDKNGFVYEEGKRRDVPLLFLPLESIKIGQKIPGFPFDKIDLAVSSIRGMDLLVSRAKITDNLLLMETQPRVIFSLENDILRQIASLQLILQKSKINGKTIQFVDLRFDKPVVVY